MGNNCFKPTESRDCIFCKIVANQSESRILFQDDDLTVFHDIRPAGVYHLQIIPNLHIDSILQLTIQYEPLIRKMKETGKKILSDFQIPEKDQQLGFHIPPFTSIHHLHMHAIALPYRTWFKRVMYPDKWLWARWWISADRFLSSLSQLDVDETWSIRCI